VSRNFHRLPVSQHLNRSSCFFSERESTRFLISKETPIIPVRSAALRCRTMVWHRHGARQCRSSLLLKEADQAALDRGLATIQLNYANSVNRGRSLTRLLKSA